MTGALGLRRTIADEEANKRAADSQAISEMRALIQAKAEARQAAKDARTAEAVTYGAPYKKGDKMVRDRMVGGNYSTTEILGDAKIEDVPGKWFQSADGQEVRYIHETSAPPKGWTQLEDPNIREERLGRIAAREQAREEKLTAYKAAIESGVDSKGKKYPKETIDAYVELFNSISPDQEYVPTKEKTWWGGTREGYRIMPKTGVVKESSVPTQAPAPVQAPAPAPASPPQQSQNSQANPAKPVTQEEFNALPSGSWFINPSDGRILKKK